MRFVLVGGANTAFTTCAFYGLALLLPVSAAFTLVYAAGLAFVVAATPRFVFGSASSTRRRAMLAGWYLMTYVVGLGAIALLKGWFDAPRIAVVLGTVMVTAPLSFIGARYIVGQRARARPGASRPQRS